MNYSDNEKVLKIFYDQCGLTNNFEKDSIYLEKAFNEIYEIWLENLNRINTVNYLIDDML